MPTTDPVDILTCTMKITSATSPPSELLHADWMVAGVQTETETADGTIWLSYSHEDRMSLSVQMSPERHERCQTGKVPWHVAFTVPEPQYSAVYRTDENRTVRIMPSEIDPKELPGD